MDESDQHQPHLEPANSNSGSSGWATPAIDGPEGGPRPDSRRTGASHQNAATTSGSPIPARAGGASESADTQGTTAAIPTSAPKGSSQMTSKAVIGIVAAAVVLTLGVVVLLYLMTQDSEAPRPATEDRTVQPPPASGPTEAAGVPRQVNLEGLSFLLPAGWNYEKVQDGYNVGPPSNPSQVKLYVNYKGASLQKLRPMCESSGDEEETSEPTSSPDPDRTGFPEQTSPSPSPSPSATPVVSGILKDTYTLIGGEQAFSESGSYECDSQEARAFNIIIVTSKGFAMTFGDPTEQVDALINSIIFE